MLARQQMNDGRVFCGLDLLLAVVEVPRAWGL